MSRIFFFIRIVAISSLTAYGLQHSISSFASQAPVSGGVVTNLLCDMEVKTTHENGKLESSNGKALIEVREIGSDVFIFVDSSMDGLSTTSVASFHLPGKVTSAENFSNDLKWHVAEERQYQGVTDYVRVIVDRRDGVILVSRRASLEGRVLRTEASGACQKSSPRRKF